MRRVMVGNPPTGATLKQRVDWLEKAVVQIAQASHDEPFDRFDEFTVTNVTESRTLDADTVTTAELADVVGTLLTDIKGRLA